MKITQNIFLKSIYAMQLWTLFLIKIYFMISIVKNFEKTLNLISKIRTTHATFFRCGTPVVLIQ